MFKFSTFVTINQTTEIINIQMKKKIFLSDNNQYEMKNYTEMKYTRNV